MPGPEVIRRIAYVGIPAQDISRELVRAELAEMGAPRIDVTGRVRSQRVEFGPGYISIVKRRAVIVSDNPSHITVERDGQSRRIRIGFVVYEREGPDYHTTFFE